MTRGVFGVFAAGYRAIDIGVVLEVRPIFKGANAAPESKLYPMLGAEVLHKPRNVKRNSNPAHFTFAIWVSAGFVVRQNIFP